MPVYNGQATVAQALRSVLDQTYPNVEVIVVDDGSTDDTWNVLQSLGSSIRAIRQRNGGIALARNTGVQAARGEFIALMDHDDLCEPERVAVQVKFLLEQSQLVLCCSDFSAFDSAGVVANSYSAEYYSLCSGAEGGVSARYSNRGQLDISDCLPVAPGQALDQAGLFELGIRSSGDWNWLVKVARIGVLGFIDRPLLRYRLSLHQISSSEHALTDALQVAHLISARDPTLHKRAPARFARQVGSMYAAAADARAEVDRGEALRLLATSVFRYRTWLKQTPRTLFKIFAPSPLLRAVRHLCRHTGHRSPSAQKSIRK